MSTPSSQANSGSISDLIKYDKYLKKKLLRLYKNNSNSKRYNKIAHELQVTRYRIKNYRLEIEQYKKTDRQVGNYKGAISKLLDKLSVK